MKQLVTLLLTLLLLAGAAGADQRDGDRPKKERVWTRGQPLWRPVWLKGTVDHQAGGQIWVKTKDNEIAQIPHMAMIYNCDPSLTNSNLNPGDVIKLRLPARSLRFIAKEGDRLLWESYEGTWWLPENIFKHKKRKKKQD